MHFKACSIGSVCYDEDYDEDLYEYEVDNESNKSSVQLSPRDVQPQIQEEVKQEHPNDEGQITPSQLKVEEDNKAEQFIKYKESAGFPYNRMNTFSKINRRNSNTNILWDYDQCTQIIKGILKKHQDFKNEEMNFGSTDPFGKEFKLKMQNEYLKMFWFSIAVCHDVIATKHPETKQLAY